MNNNKLSKFNYITEQEDKIIIFNTLSGYILFCNKKDKEYQDVKKVLNEEYDNVNPKLIYFLLEKGILVDIDINEKNLAELNYYERIFSNNLDLTILPTEQCNFRCIYCYEEFKNGSMSEEVMDRIIKFLKKEIRRYSSLHVSWFGGEPLLQLDKILALSEEIIKVCNFMHKIYSSSITTNGYLLDLQTFKNLLLAKVTNYQITIDGIEERHNTTRVTINNQPTFDKIIKNLIAIKENIKSRTFTICIRCNVTEESIDKLDEYLEYMYKIFGKDDRFEFYFRPVGNWRTEKIDNSKILDNDSKILNKLLSSKIKLNYNGYYDLLLNSECHFSRRNSFVIRSTGMLSKCTVFLDESILGKIEHNGTITYRKDKVAKWILPDITYQQNQNCENCLFLSRCHGNSCAAKKFAIDKLENNCGYEVNSLERILKLILDNRGNKYIINIAEVL